VVPAVFCVDDDAAFRPSLKKGDTPQPPDTEELFVAPLKNRTNNTSFSLSLLLLLSYLPTMSLCFVERVEGAGERGMEKKGPRTRDVVVAAVRVDGMALARAGEWRHDPEVIWTAVNKDGRSIAFVPKESPFRTPELCEAAVAQDWRAVFALDCTERTDAVCRIVRVAAESGPCDPNRESCGPCGVVEVEEEEEQEQEAPICQGDQACVCVCCWGARECAEVGGYEVEVEEDEEDEAAEAAEDAEEEYEYRVDYWNDW